MAFPSSPSTRAIWTRRCTLAVPEADPATLRRPEASAADIVESLLAVLPDRALRPLAVRT